MAYYRASSNSLQIEKSYVENCLREDHFNKKKNNRYLNKCLNCAKHRIYNMIYSND